MIIKKFFGKKVKLRKFPTESENFSKVGGKCETGGEMHHGLRGDGRPWPPELRTFSLPPPSSLQIIKHHIHHASLSVTPRAFHSKLKLHLFKLSFSDSVPRQFVYGHFVYDTSSTDISSTTVYQRTGQLYIQIMFQQIIIFINSNLYLHCDSFLSIPLTLTL